MLRLPPNFTIFDAVITPCFQEYQWLSLRTSQTQRTRRFRPSFNCAHLPPLQPFSLSSLRLPLTRHALWLCAKPNRILPPAFFICAQA